MTKVFKREEGREAEGVREGVSECEKDVLTLVHPLNASDSDRSNQSLEWGTRSPTWAVVLLDLSPAPPLSASPGSWMCVRAEARQRITVL